MNEVCIACRSPKADTPCGICESPICRNCRIFLDKDAFLFQAELEADLKHSFYCPNCYDEKVAPPLAQYNQDVETARGVFVYFTTAKRKVPTLKKSLIKVKVENSPDRDQTILKLAFQAVKQGFNAIIETEVVSAKVRNEGYQKSAWSGKAIPVMVDAVRMQLEFERTEF